MIERITQDSDDGIRQHAQKEAARAASSSSILPVYPNTLDKHLTDGVSPEINKTDGLYPFFARFAKGENRPAHATTETYQQESHTQDMESGEWHQADYTRADGSKVSVAARMTHDGDYLIDVYTKRPNGSFEDLMLSSKGIEHALGSAVRFADGSTFAHFGPYGQGHDDPRYQEAMSMAREVASDLFFG